MKKRLVDVDVLKVNLKQNTGILGGRDLLDRECESKVLNKCVSVTFWFDLFLPFATGCIVPCISRLRREGVPGVAWRMYFVRDLTRYQAP